MTEIERRELRASVRAGAFKRYRRPAGTEVYGNRTRARAILKHPAWTRYVEWSDDDG